MYDLHKNPTHTFNTFLFYNLYNIFYYQPGIDQWHFWWANILTSAL